VVFTDESSIHLERHGKISFRRKWEQPKLKGRPKHPFKVHVWTGISKRGATRILILTGIMDSTFYVNSILRPSTSLYAGQQHQLVENSPREPRLESHRNGLART